MTQDKKDRAPKKLELDSETVKDLTIPAQPPPAGARTRVGMTDGCKSNVDEQCDTK